MQMVSGPCGTCSICLCSIAAENEAFLDLCFHQFCYKCIKEWTQTQRKHPPQKGARFTCPLCKQPYYSIIFDCHESAFRREQVAEQPTRSRQVGIPGPGASFSELTSAHRRRRSVYYSPWEERAGSATGQDLVSQKLAGRDDVVKWVKRELQALMWQDDVALVMQHVLGTLRSATQPSSHATPTEASTATAPSTAAGRRSVAATHLMRGAPPTAGQRSGPAGRGVLKQPLTLGASHARQPGPACAAAEEVVRAVCRASEPYVFEHAERFAEELVGFVASGLTLAAHDRHHIQQQQQQQQEQQRACAELAPRPQNPAHADGRALEAQGAAPRGGDEVGEAAGRKRLREGSSREAGSWGAAGGGSGAGGSDPDSGSGSLSEGRQGVELARSDSEGYLGLLLAQGGPWGSQQTQGDPGEEGALPQSTPPADRCTAAANHSMQRVSDASAAAAAAADFVGTGRQASAVVGSPHGGALGSSSEGVGEPPPGSGQHLQELRAAARRSVEAHRNRAYQRPQ